MLATTINKYCFVTLRYLPQFFDYKHRIRYYKKEEVNTLNDIEHPSVRECLKYMRMDDGVEIVHHADLPALSGLGSSSTFTVSLLHALYSIKQTMPTKRELALNAIDIEQNKIKENVGSQDQVAAAFGGFNTIEFNAKSTFEVQPIVIGQNKIEKLQEHRMLFFTGFSRLASVVAGEQIENIKKNKIDLSEMMTFTDEALSILFSTTPCFNDFGKLLHEQWKIKRSLTTSISNAEIDQIYTKGINAGALGGKLLGAGGGGFMLFYVEPSKQEQVKKALSDLLYVPINFEFTGSQIVYYSHHG